MDIWFSMTLTGFTSIYIYLYRGDEGQPAKAYWAPLTVTRGLEPCFSFQPMGSLEPLEF